MAIHDNQEDKSTVILDLNELKSKQKKTEQDLSSLVKNLEFKSEVINEKVIEDQPTTSLVTPTSSMVELNEIEFSVGPNIEPLQELEEQVEKFDIVFFELGSPYFSGKQDRFQTHHNLIFAQDLKELNSEVKKPGFKFLFFNYEQGAKAVNQLILQIKKKFPHIMCIIVAKNLSPNKVNVHKQTPFAAHGYFAESDLNTDKIEEKLNQLHSKHLNKAA